MMICLHCMISGLTEARATRLFLPEARYYEALGPAAQTLEVAE